MVNTTIVSVVVPAHNAGDLLLRQLAALEAQTCSEGYEILVVDDHSTDSSLHNLTVRLGDSLTRTRVIRLPVQGGPSAARNAGARAAQGRILAFTDADDVVSPTWVAGAALLGRGFGTGSLRPFVDGSPPAWYGSANPPTHFSFLPYAPGANFIIERELFLRAGGFRVDRRVGEDIDLSWRLQLAGVPFQRVDCHVAVRQRSTTQSTFKQYYSYGRSDPQLLRDFMPDGAMRPSPATAVRSYLGLAARLPLLASPDLRRRWLHQLGRRTGRLIGSVETMNLCL